MVETKKSSVVCLLGGTGFIVGDHEIATAAHCLYKDGGTYSSNQFFIKDGNKTIYLTPTYYHIPDTYTKGYSEYDYALITVKEDLTQYGRFQLGVITDSFAQSEKDVFVTGYPQITDPKEYENIPGYSYGMQLTASGAVKDSTNTFIRYFADTAGGSSGAPVYIHEEYDGNSYDTAIAVHFAGGGTFNSGIRLNAAHLQFYMNNPYE